MARTVKVLRVPIALLHQRVFGTSRRLPKWDLELTERLKAPIKPVQRIVPPSTLLETRKTWTISPGQGIFRHLTYLRRNFYELQGDVVCRNCGEVARNANDRLNHANCEGEIAETCKRILTEGMCVICQAEIFEDDNTISICYCGAPVCSIECLAFWDSMNPPDFHTVLKEVQKEGKHRGRHVGRY